MEQLLKTIAELQTAVWSTAALSAALDGGAVAALDEPRTAADIAERCALPPAVAACLLDVLVALDLAGRDGDRYALTGAGEPLRTPQARAHAGAELRATLWQAGELHEAARSGRLEPGWNVEHEGLVDSQGVLSEGNVRRMLALIDAAPGLRDRLSSPGARILDVGAGSAGVAIGLCRAFPEASVVALEPAPIPLEHARTRVAEAGLTERIELRPRPIEKLSDQDTFDLVFFPQMFLDDQVLEPGLARAHAALRPGGWLLSLSMGAPGDTPVEATARLMQSLWCGTVRSHARVHQLLESAGFDPVRAVDAGHPVFQPFLARAAVGDGPVPALE